MRCTSKCLSKHIRFKTDWSEEYAQGPEIREYWQSLAKKHDVYSLVRLNTLVKGTYWNDKDAQWKVELGKKGSMSTEYFDFVILATGIFNTWKMPDIPGINDYKGHLRHSSDWDANFDPTGKSIATIGNGASGIQLTAAIQKIAGHIDHYARSKTWIAGSWNPNTKERKDTPMPFTDEEKEVFKSPESYLKYRKDLEQKFYRDLDSYLVNTEKSKKARQTFTEAMKVRTEDKPELLEKLIPDFPPQCRRLTPGPGYLEALTQPNLSFIQTPIKRFTATGIETTDGVHREVDAIICSTGANVSYAPPFPVVAGEYDLSRDWKQDGKFGWPYTYLGVSTPGFPNLAFVMGKLTNMMNAELIISGPHPGGPSGTVPHAAETQITYVARMLRKMSSQRIQTITNMSRNCSSWANGGIPGARIHGYFPASASALTNIKREPRWEDFDYTYDRPENRFAYWGEGRTKREYDENHDMTPYLKLAKNIDLRDIHEQWWEF
ncbi:hypothetical protein MRB53_040041 [Persea americana]|nr:hypothetical protein MRB53_040041 [Persea americana]